MLVKAILINILLLAVYCVLIVSGSADGSRGFNIAIGAGVCIAAHVAINVVSGLLMLALGKRELSTALLISGAVVAVAGFLSWLLLLSIYG